MLFAGGHRRASNDPRRSSAIGLNSQPSSPSHRHHHSTHKNVSPRRSANPMNNFLSPEHALLEPRNKLEKSRSEDHSAHRTTDAPPSPRHSNHHGNHQHRRARSPGGGRGTTHEAKHRPQTPDIIARDAELAARKAKTREKLQPRIKESISDNMLIESCSTDHSEHQSPGKTSSDTDNKSKSTTIRRSHHHHHKPKKKQSSDCVIA